MDNWLTVGPALSADTGSAAVPIVALESTVISHGLPYPQNLELALRVEEIVRAEGAIPATIGVIAGQITAGLDRTQIEHLATARGVLKVSLATCRLSWLESLTARPQWPLLPGRRSAPAFRFSPQEASAACIALRLLCR